MDKTLFSKAICHHVAFSVDMLERDVLKIPHEGFAAGNEGAKRMKRNIIIKSQFKENCRVGLNLNMSNIAVKSLFKTIE